MSTEKFNLGKRLKEVRLFRGYTAAEYTSWFLKIGRSQYTKYESGKNMSMLTLFKILNCWGISEQSFFSGKDIQETDFSKSCPDQLKEIALFVIENYDPLKLDSKLRLTINKPITEVPGTDRNSALYSYLKNILKCNDSIAEKQIIAGVKNLDPAIRITKIIVE